MIKLNLISEALKVKIRVSCKYKTPIPRHIVLEDNYLGIGGSVLSLWKG